MIPAPGRLTPALTELFHRYVQAREEGREVDVEALLAEAGAGAGELGARIESYESIQRTSLRIAERDASFPRRIGRFGILQSLGSGGLGRVYLARDPELGRNVALKVLDGSAAEAESERAWIRNEARSLARIEHPGVVRVFEVGTDGSRDHVAMEHLPGPSLADVVRELRRLRGREEEIDADGEEPSGGEAARLALELLPFSARARLLLALADALATCHDQGVLHRDVKPENVLFDAEGAPRLIDFGLAHLPGPEEGRTLVTQRLVGTPSYVAPEQVQSGRTGTDPRSDQFSFGVLAYELLALERPFDRGTRTGTLAAVVEAAPRAPRRVEPGVPPDLERVVLHCLEREPRNRHPGMAAVAEDLRAFLANRPVSVGAPSLAHLGRLFLRRHRRRVAVLAVAAAAALGAALLAAAGTHYEREAELRSALRGLAAEEPSLPAHFEDRLLALEALREEARRLDARPLGRLRPGALAPRVEEALEGTSAALRAGVLAAMRRSEERGVDFQGRAWRHAVDLEERVCPSCEGTRDLRELGRVLLAEEELEGLRHALFQRTVAGPSVRWRGTSVARPIELVERPSPGAYRWIAWDAAGSEVLWEAERVLEGAWSPPWRLEVGRRDPALLAATVEVARGEEEISPIGGGDEPPVQVLVPRFRILPRPVTVAELERHRAATGTAPAVPDANTGRAPDAPAWATAVEAEAFARWAGGRVPTGIELWRFHRTTRRELPSIGRDAHGEWVSDPSTLSGFGTRTFVKYGRGEGGADELTWTYVDGPEDFRVVHRVGSGSDGALQAELTFRVAFTADDEAAVLAAGELDLGADSARD